MSQGGVFHQRETMIMYPEVCSAGEGAISVSVAG